MPPGKPRVLPLLGQMRSVYYRVHPNGRDRTRMSPGSSEPTCPAALRAGQCGDAPARPSMTQRIRLDGVTLSCLVEGHGPLIVILHGSPETSYAWRKQIPVLSEHFRADPLARRRARALHRTRLGGILAWATAHAVSRSGLAPRGAERQAAAAQLVRPLLSPASGSQACAPAERRRTDR